jgi:hypothetical protein
MIPKLPKNERSEALLIKTKTKNENGKNVDTVD